MTTRGHLRLVGGTAAPADLRPEPQKCEDDPKAVFLRAMALQPVDAVVVLLDPDNYLHILSTCQTHNDDIAMLHKGIALSLELDTGSGNEG